MNERRTGGSVGDAPRLPDEHVSPDQHDVHPARDRRDGEAGVSDRSDRHPAHAPRRPGRGRSGGGGEDLVDPRRRAGDAAWEPAARSVHAAARLRARPGAGVEAVAHVAARSAHPPGVPGGGLHRRALVRRPRRRARARPLRHQSGRGGDAGADAGRADVQLHGTRPRRVRPGALAVTRREDQACPVRGCHQSLRAQPALSVVRCLRLAKDPDRPLRRHASAGRRGTAIRHRRDRRRRAAGAAAGFDRPSWSGRARALARLADRRRGARAHPARSRAGAAELRRGAAGGVDGGAGARASGGGHRHRRRLRVGAPGRKRLADPGRLSRRAGRRHARGADRGPRAAGGDGPRGRGAGGRAA